MDENSLTSAPASTPQKAVTPTPLTNPKSTPVQTQTPKPTQRLPQAQTTQTPAPTSKPTAVASPSASQTTPPKPSPTSAPNPTLTSPPAGTPTPTPKPAPAQTPSPAPTIQLTPTPAVTPTPQPSVEITPTSSPMPTLTPTSTPTPTLSPTPIPTPTPKPVPLPSTFNETYNPVNYSGKKVVCVILDDGTQDHYTTALPILQKYGFKATFAVITSLASSDNPAYMNWSEVKSLQNMGMDIESHSVNHLSLSNLDNNSLYWEIGGSKQIFADHGILTNVFIYPYGDGASSEAVKNVVKQYYLAARGIGYGGINMVADRYNLLSNDISPATSMEDFALRLSTAMPYTLIHYHQIGDGCVSAQTFDAQMHYLKQNNFTVLTLKEAFIK
jgi:peptidoglycan/xylan/chitin deacetylase (PgdA/CDA1 family)